MKKIAGILMIILATVIVPSLIQALTPEGGCWVSGVGTISGGEGTRDSFGGNAMPMKDGRVRGEWTHISIGSEVIFNGRVTYIACEKVTGPGPGVPEAIPNYAFFGGMGKLNGVDGYLFQVEALDSGEPGIYQDEYSIKIFYGSALVYEAEGQITGGNFQIRPPNEGHPF